MKTSEMIAMLENNPDLKFKSSHPFIKNNFIYVDEYGIVRWGGEGQNGELFIVIGKKADNWALVREPVPVWEAFKALIEGKTIRCEVELKDYRYGFLLSPESFECISRGFDIKWLKTGTWYIVE